MKDKVHIIQDLKRTNISGVFHSDMVELPEIIFAHQEWKTAIFQFPEYLKNEENRDFWEPFHSFVAASASSFFMKPCCFNNSPNYYPVLRISSELRLDEVSQSIPTPYRQAFLTNWEGDLIWNGKAKWGIFHSQYFWVLILGYSQEVSGIFEQHLKNHPCKLSVNEFSRNLEEEMRHQSGSSSKEEIGAFLEGLAKQGLYHRKKDD